MESGDCILLSKTRTKKTCIKLKNNYNPCILCISRCKLKINKPMLTIWDLIISLVDLVFLKKISAMCCTLGVFKIPCQGQQVTTICHQLSSFQEIDRLWLDAGVVFNAFHSACCVKTDSRGHGERQRDWGSSSVTISACIWGVIFVFLAAVNTKWRPHPVTFPKGGNQGRVTVMLRSEEQRWPAARASIRGARRSANHTRPVLGSAPLIVD